MLDSLSSYLKKYFSETIIRAIFVTIPFQKYNIEGNATKFFSLCWDASILTSENFRCVLVFYAFCFEFSKLQLAAWLVPDKKIWWPLRSNWRNPLCVIVTRGEIIDAEGGDSVLHFLCVFVHTIPSFVAKWFKCFFSFLWKKSFLL